VPGVALVPVLVYVGGLFGGTGVEELTTKFEMLQKFYAVTDSLRYHWGVEADWLIALKLSLEGAGRNIEYRGTGPTG